AFAFATCAAVVPDAACPVLVPVSLLDPAALLPQAATVRQAAAASADVATRGQRFPWNIVCLLRMSTTCWAGRHGRGFRRAVNASITASVVPGSSGCARRHRRLWCGAHPADGSEPIFMFKSWQWAIREDL